MTATPSTPPPTQQSAPSSPSAARGRGLTIAGIAVAAVVTVYLGLVAATGDGLPRGAHVLGVDVGGQTEQQAVATLNTALADQVDADLDVVVGGTTVTVVPSEAGLGFDADATVEGYAGRIWNPVTLLTQFTGGPTIDPVVTVDETRLEETVATLAAEVDSPAVEPTITVSGAKPVVKPGSVGSVLDREASQQAIRDAYLVSTAPIVLPIVESDPTVTDEAAGEALGVATTAVSAPVTVEVDGITATIPAATIAKALSFRAQDGALEPTLDGDVLRASIADDIASIESPGRDAGWKIVAGKPVVVPSKVGRGVNPELLAADVAAVLTGTDAAARTITAQIGTIEPAAHDGEGEDARRRRGAGIVPAELPVRGVPRAEHRPGREVHPEHAAHAGRDVLAQRHHRRAHARERLHQGLRRRPRRRVRRGPRRRRLGLGDHHVVRGVLLRPRAGLHPGALDLDLALPTGSRGDGRLGLVRHEVPQRHQARGAHQDRMRNTSLTVTMYGTKVYDEIRAVSGPRENVRPFKTIYSEKKGCLAQGGSPGFSIVVTRVFVIDGKVVKREPIRTVYRPSPTVICGPDPSKKPTPSPSASGTGSPSPSGTAKPSPSPSKPA